MINPLRRACDRVAAMLGYVPAHLLARARQSRAVALRQVCAERRRRSAAIDHAQALELVLGQLEAEVRELRRVADKVRPQPKVEVRDGA
jgi:hypothetical protein